MATKQYHTAAAAACIPVGKFFEKTYVKVDQHGATIAPDRFDDKPLIICCTHRSQADYFLIGYILNRMGIKDLRFAAGDNLTELPIIGPRFQSWGAFAVERDSSLKKSYVRSLCDKVVSMLKEKDSIIVFPEGGRSYKGGMLDIKGGVLAAGILAHEQNPDDPVYVLPMSISWERLPELLYFNLLAKGKTMRKPGNGVVKQFVGSLYYYGADLVAAAALFAASWSGRRQGSIHIDIGEPFAVDQVVDIAGRKLPNARDDFAAHRVSIQALCKVVREKFLGLYALLPEHVLASVIAERGPLNAETAMPLCTEMVSRLERAGRNVRCIKPLDAAALVQTGIKQLKRMKAIEIKNGITIIRKKWVLEYYAAGVEF